MDPTPDAVLQAAVAASPLSAKYAATSTQGAAAILASRTTARAATAGTAAAPGTADAPLTPAQQRRQAEAEARAERKAKEAAEREERAKRRQAERIQKEVVSGGMRIARDVLKNLFKR